MTKSSICSIDGCGKPRSKKGWCNAHYLRWYRFGDVNHLTVTPDGEPDRWLRAHVDHEGDECLKWPFATGWDGRGRIANKNFPQAHRLMCYLRYGDAPSDVHEAAHSCGKGHEGCVNPNHLRWATPVENAADKEVHGTQRRGEEHHTSKLTAFQVALIREMEGLFSQREIGETFGVHSETVGDIFRGLTWNESKIPSSPPS